MTDKLTIALGVEEFVFLLFFVVIVILIRKTFPRFIEKRVANVANVFENKITETNTLLKNIENTLGKVVSEIDAQTLAVKETTKQTWENMVYNDNIQPAKRLRAFRKYLGIGGNGNCKDYAMRKIILQNKKEWNDVFQEPEDFTIINRYDYDKVMDEIKTMLH